MPTYHRPVAIQRPSSMIVTKQSATAYLLEFESEQEVRDEHAMNLAHGALRIPTGDKVALYTPLAVTLRGPFGSELQVRATVVAMLPDGLALGYEGDPDAILATLLEGAPREESDADVASESAADAANETGASDASPDRAQTAWDRVRSLPQMQKILLAVKAEKADRALLLQDSDPRVLLSLLRNPRITVEEVSRMTRSSALTYHIAEAILKAAQWSSNLDVRLGLIHNPKTPQQFALRILPTLPEAEVRIIARGGTSMALKQAALRRLQKP
jgi:hypothetical protein